MLEGLLQRDRCLRFQASSYGEEHAQWVTGLLGCRSRLLRLGQQPRVLRVCRWQGVKPRGGPSGNPSVVLVQLDDATRQLQHLQDEAQQLAKVTAAS